MRRGFTLLEVVVALAIFAAGILALLSLLRGSLLLSEGARDLSVAQVYASQRMEEAMLSPDPAAGTERGIFGEKYRWEMETTLPPPEAESPFREVRIRVTIRWEEEGDGRAVDLAASRWIRRKGDGPT
ncbi:MAG: hypothetical protein Kow00128_22230 [Deltaproteobacteria bacterium]